MQSSKKPSGEDMARHHIKKKENIPKMRDLISKAKDNKSSLFTQGLQRRLEFSNLSLCVYDRHKVLINDIFLNPNINTFVSYNDKALHSWCPETLELISSLNFNDTEGSNSQNQVQSISCLCYSQSFHLYFACSKDFKLIVFNEHLNIIHQQKMPVGMVQIILFFEKQKQLFVGGKEGCFIIDLYIKLQYSSTRAIFLDPKGSSIQCNIKRGKYSEFTEEEQGYSIKKLYGINEWVKGMKIFESQKLVVAWKKEILSQNTHGVIPPEDNQRGQAKATQDQIFFYALEDDDIMYKQGDVWSRYYDSSIKDDFITDLLVFKDQKFFITAHNYGDIHLRKLVEIKLLENDADQGESKSIHIFKGHSRKVTSLAPVKSKNTYFVSASIDSKVKIWCMEKMIELYCFDLSIESPVHNSAMADSIMNVKLISDKIYAMIFRGFIEIGLISHLASSYYISKQKISSLGKCYKKCSAISKNNPDALFISFNDNSIVMLDPVDKEVISTIYPPPTPAEVIKVFFCTSIQRMFLLLNQGSICIYKVDSQTGTLEKLKESKSLKDYESKSLTQAITCLTTCYTCPPQYDCEIFSDLHKYKEPENPDYEFNGTPEEIENDMLDRFLVIGLSKGTIIFVRVDNIDYIYARFSLHRQAITHIHEIREHRVFISICEEFEMHIFGFDDYREHVYQRFNIQREVFQIITSKSNQLLMCFESGDSEILVWNDEDKELMKLDIDKSDEHDDSLTCCDTLPESGLYVTGDKAGLVKIWNCKKQLIREIKFVEPINSVVFLNDRADLLVGHSGNISKLDANDFMDRKMLVNEENFSDFMTQATVVEKNWFKRISQKSTKDQQLLQSSSQKKESGQKGMQASKKLNLALPDEEKKSAKKGTQMSSRDSPPNKVKHERPKFTASISTIKPIEATPAGNQGGETTKYDQSKRTRYVDPQPNIKTQRSSYPSHQVIASSAAALPPLPISQDGKPQVAQIFDSQVSNSNTGSQTTTVRKNNLKNQLNELRKTCVNVPSVPLNYIKARQRAQEYEKQMKKLKNGNTRRMMTEQRISNNIIATNNPADPSQFHDILVSHSAQVVNYKNKVNTVYSEKNKTSTGNQTGFNIYKKDAEIGVSKLMLNSQISDGKQSADKNKQVNQPAILGNSTNTFSIFDNASFDAKQKLINKEKNAKLAGIYKPPQSNFVIVPLKEQTQSSERKSHLESKQNGSPDDHHKPARESNIVSHVSHYRKSDEFSLKTINQNLNDSQRCVEADHTETNDSPIKQNMFSSTLKYSEINKVGQSFNVNKKSSSPHEPMEIKEKSVLDQIEDNQHAMKMGGHMSSELTELNHFMGGTSQQQSSQFFLNPKNGNQQSMHPIQEASSSQKLNSIPPQADEIENEEGDYQNNEMFRVQQFIKQGINDKSSKAPEMMKLAENKSPGAKSEIKQYSHLIRGSSRAQNSNEFVATRLQQRANQLQQVQVHIVTNAKMKDSMEGLLTSKDGSHKLFQAIHDIIQPSTEGNDRALSNDYQRMLYADGQGFENDYSRSPPGSPPKTKPNKGIVELRVKTAKFNRQQREQMIQQRGSHHPLTKSMLGHQTHYGVMSDRPVPFDKKNSYYQSQRFMSQQTGLITNPHNDEFSQEKKDDFGGDSAALKLPNHPLFGTNRPPLTSDQRGYSQSRRQKSQQKRNQKHEGGDLMPIYVKSQLPAGAHIPSKGLFQPQPKANRGNYHRKPKTAVNQQRNKTSMIHQPGHSSGYDTNQAPQFMYQSGKINSQSMVSGIISLKAGRPERAISNYKKNMTNIQILNNIVSCAGSDPQASQTAYAQTNPHPTKPPLENDMIPGNDVGRFNSNKNVQSGSPIAPDLQLGSWFHKRL